MAYKTTVKKACTSRDEALVEFYSQIEAMGWELVDGNFTSKNIPYTDVDTTNNWCTSSGHSLSSGTPVQIVSSGTIPGGLAINTLYFVVNPTTNTFKLSTTYNGAAIDITSQGSGSHTIKEAYRVYKSNGEDSDKIYEYIKIVSYSDTINIKIAAFYKYDVSTHTSYCHALNSASNYTSVLCSSSFYLWIHGNKNIINIHTKVVSTYYRCMFGHMKSFTPLVVNLTASGIAGSNVSLVVESSEDFEVEGRCQIVGNAYEGRDDLIVNSIPDSTHLIIATLPRDYSPNSKIGHSPSTFGISDIAATNFGVTNPMNAVGLTDASWSNGTQHGMLATANIDPDYRSNKYVLFPVCYGAEYSAGSNYTSMGKYMDDFVFNCPETGMTSEDTLGVFKRSSGTSSGSNDSVTFNDTTKSWTTNVYTNKVIIITFGSGAGQIKKIASNTSTSVTLPSGWIFEIVPDATSQYMICDEGYRYLFPTWGKALREGY